MLLLFGPAGPELAGGGCWELLGGDGLRPFPPALAGKLPSVAEALTMEGARS